MNDADYIEQKARELDQQERYARREGMFALAVCYQQLASWTRARMLTFPLRGMGALSVAVHFADDKAVAYGTLPIANWHDAARHLVHAAMRLGFPPVLPVVDSELLAAECTRLMDQVREISEGMAALKSPTETDASSPG